MESSTNHLVLQHKLDRVFGIVKCARTVYIRVVKHNSELHITVTEDRRKTRLSGVPVATAVGFALLFISSVGVASAAPIPFTIAINGNVSILQAPDASNLTVGDTINGTGTFSPFGSATLSELGTATFIMLPGPQFLPVLIMNNVTVSFNGGLDTLIAHTW